MTSPAEEENEVEGTGAEDASGPGRRLTDAEFAEIRELYELGKAGLSELATTYKISRQTLSRRFKDVGAKKGSRAHELAAAAKKAAVAATGVSAGATIERFADRRAEWIEETRMNGYQALKEARLIGRKIMSENLRATPPRPMAHIDDDLKALARYNKLLIDNIAASIELLQANDHVDETTLPSLSIEDLTDDDILEHHKNIGALPEDATVADMLAENDEDGEEGSP
ncbi:hypothetical protein [Ancylobacter rudongensis]|uniref:Uncharacterized protein n=1 Tax=Ancylobacter rudongensis TaxID=177413 RepID=A0A1G4UPR8_9HYPH|nr:hypothetical protein [Ancylobacter rudongensis]SCW95622.1 hypothetical protein SAMN05660859_0068 [Ancylobacter rudongensis]